MAQDNTLANKINNLYRMFSKYKIKNSLELQEQLDFQSKRSNDPDRRTLLSRPLHSLTHNDLHRFSFGGLSIWNVNDFKHFLPRMFELAITSRSNDADNHYEEVFRETLNSVRMDKVFYDLAKADFPSFPKEDKMAIREVFQEYFKILVRFPFAAMFCDTPQMYFEGLTKLQEEIDYYLGYWESVFEPVSIIKQAEFFNYVVDNIFQYGFVNLSEDSCTKQRLPTLNEEKLTTWFKSEKRKTVWEDLYLKCMGDTTYDALSDAVRSHELLSQT